MPRLQIAAQLVLPCKIFEIGEDLSRSGINTGPVNLGLKTPGVIMRWDVARTTDRVTLVSDLPLFLLSQSIAQMSLTQGTCSRTKCQKFLRSSRRW